MAHEIVSHYLSCVLITESLIEVVNQAVSILEPLYKEGKFEALAFTGNSGAMVGPAIAMRLGCDMILVRKKEAKGHSMYNVEGAVDAKYCIVDDLISTGKTIDTIKESIMENCQNSAHVCTYLYSPTAYTSSNDREYYKVI